MTNKWLILSTHLVLFCPPYHLSFFHHLAPQNHLQGGESTHFENYSLSIKRIVGTLYKKIIELWLNLKVSFN